MSAWLKTPKKKKTLWLPKKGELKKKLVAKEDVEVKMALKKTADQTQNKDGESRSLNWIKVETCSECLKRSKKKKGNKKQRSKEVKNRGKKEGEIKTQTNKTKKKKGKEKLQKRRNRRGGKRR